MKKIKKAILGSLSILAISLALWITVLLNPSITYAHSTTFDNVTVYHNQALEIETEEIIKNAIAITKDSELFAPNLKRDLCLNDGSYYPKLHPFAGGIAYSFSNKSVIYGSVPDFSSNTSAYKWEVNQNELRKVDLTWLLAHEFTHNLQYEHDILFPLKVEFWQQEGYAEYISRDWKDDGKLKEKIDLLLLEERKPHIGLPVITLADGTVQMLSYFKYGLMVQYLVEHEDMDFKAIMKDSRSFEEVTELMMHWHGRE